MAELGESAMNLNSLPEASSDELDSFFGKETVDTVEAKVSSEKIPEEGVVLSNDGTPLIGDLESDNKKAVVVDDTGTPVEDAYVAGTYLKDLNERYELKLNMENLPEGLTQEQELAAVRDIMDKRMSNQTEQLETLVNYDKIMESDDEMKMFLKARADGKSLKDMFAEIGGQVQYTDDEFHMKAYFKDTYGFDDEQIESEIQKMKDSGVYENNKNKIVTAAKNREAVEQENARKLADAEIEKENQLYEQQISEYGKFLKETDGFGDFKFDGGMKKELFIHATKLGTDGFTTLERDVQSKENALKASVAIMYWPQIVKVLSSTASEKSKQTLLDQLAMSPTELQSSSAPPVDAFNEKEYNFVADSF